MIVHSWNEFTIANAVVDVPITNANKPKIINNTFFRIIVNFENLDFVLTKTKISITAGSIMPSTDKHNAPNNEMNKSNFGIATANRTRKDERLLIKTNIFKSILIKRPTEFKFLHVSITIAVRKTYSQNNLWRSFWILSFM